MSHQQFKVLAEFNIAEEEQPPFSLDSPTTTTTQMNGQQLLAIYNLLKIRWVLGRMKEHPSLSSITNTHDSTNTSTNNNSNNNKNDNDNNDEDDLLHHHHLGYKVQILSSHIHDWLSKLLSIIDRNVLLQHEQIK